ncbi:MAG TPA: glycosyltransferase [Sphingobacterium sp.]|jgi:glycosyltransferase involved in cell wall biosynthesis|nr:glycosyltransferase [Sphingobacterium sp.]
MPDKNNIQITVFMAAYNAADYIAASIESVLKQTYDHFELLIVDDGSTDNTVEIIQRFHDPRIRLIQNDGNKGQPYTRNLALTEAKGEFLAVLDSDDIAFPNRLEIQLQHFLDRPQLAVLGGQVYVIDKYGQRTGQEMIPICGSKQLHSALLLHNSFVHPTVMMRMSAFKDIGGYPNHLVAQDYALFSRIALKYEVDNIPEYLGEYRMHDNNISIRKKHLADEQLRAILRYQLDKLLPETSHIDLDILRSPVINSKYSPEEYYAVYREIILHNRQRKLYPIVELERIFFDNWYVIVMEKGRSKTFPLFLRKPVFNRRYVTAKQIRKTFKQSLKYLLGIRR